MRFSTFFISGWLLASVSGAGAQTAGLRLEAVPPDRTRCERDVSQYIKAMRFVRETSGSQTSDKFMARYVSEVEVEKVSAENGPCTAAKLLRNKGLL